MNSTVSSLIMYPGSLLRSGFKSATNTCKKIIGRVKHNPKSTNGLASASTAANTKISADGRDKPVAIQEC